MLIFLLISCPLGWCEEMPVLVLVEVEAGSDITMRADGVSILKVGGHRQPAGPGRTKLSLGRTGSRLIQTTASHSLDIMVGLIFIIYHRIYMHT